MAKQKKQDTTTGNGNTKAPILASGNAPTADGLKQSRKRTSIAAGSTKPVSIAEALSLLQTQVLDIQSLGCNAILAARGSRIYIVIGVPASIGEASIKDGHICLKGQKVITL